MRRHLIIPDVQTKPGSCSDHLVWAARAAIDYKPDVIIVGGDFADMPSLSCHEKAGSKHTIGQNVKADFDAANEAFERFQSPIQAEIDRIKRNKAAWEPECELLFGNHENRITNALNAEPKYEGLFGLDSFKTPGFRRHDFLKILTIDGLKYCHYFPQPFSGKAIGGTIVSRLNNIGSSFCQFHQQGFLYASKQYPDHIKHGLVCGRFYFEDEHYRPQDVQRSEWNGLVVLNEVHDQNGNGATFDLMPLSMNYLRRKYA